MSTSMFSSEPAAGAKPPAEHTTPHVIEGTLTSTKAVDFVKGDLLVHAYVNDVEVAQAPVDAKGHYKLAFRHRAAAPSFELRVLPRNAEGIEAAQVPSIVKAYSASRFMKSESGSYYSNIKLMIPYDWFEWVFFIRTTYHVTGTVYASQYIFGIPVTFTPLGGVKIDFYSIPSTSTGTEHFLGSAQADANGAYQFAFVWKHFIFMFPWVNVIPDVRAKVSQLVDGTWHEIYVSTDQWNITTNFTLNLYVPKENVTLVADPGPRPTGATEFRFTTVGLLPIDTTRIAGGYATSQPGDPITLSHQPFCGTLRIFGLFGQGTSVTTYTMEVADATAAGPTAGTWRFVTDSLSNAKWNPVTHRWDSRTLGPDPVTHRYQNIDTEPEVDWTEHALKLTWNSANQPDGFYALRIRGYDASNNLVREEVMPVIRVANRMPDAALLATAAASSACGNVHVPPGGGNLAFQVTAYDPNGHIWSYSLGGTRGRDALSAGTAVGQGRPTAGANWVGVQGATVQFAVDALPANLQACAAVAYNFELTVYGSATNCYNPHPLGLTPETNLVVSP